LIETDDYVHQDAKKHDKIQETELANMKTKAQLLKLEFVFSSRILGSSSKNLGIRVLKAKQ
jgi:hypothetical protein